MTDRTITVSARPPLWRDVRVLRVVAQLVFLVLVVAAGMVLWNNLTVNIRQTGLPTGYDYLRRPAGFTILGSDFNPAQTNLQAIRVGVKNTVLVSAIGIVMATVIGILVGVARLSSNWLVRKSAAFYVETLRNVPVLLIIFFASLAIIAQALPQLSNAWYVPGRLVVSNRIIAVPWLQSSSDLTFHVGWSALVVGIPVASYVWWWARRAGLSRLPERVRPLMPVVLAVAAFLVTGLAVYAIAADRRQISAVVTFWLSILTVLTVVLWVAAWRTRVSDRTGDPHHRVIWAFGTFLLVGAVAFIVTDTPLEISGPRLDGRQVFGGISMVQSYAALLVALTLYTASHIAEIVRGSILAVPKGQTEAATALALSPFQRMRFVILPQSFRIMVPPLANQYLNLTKNSSLGIAIGFQELTTVTSTIIGNGNPATQSIAILMAIYLSFSLIISAVTNLINRKLQLAGRS